MQRDVLYLLTHHLSIFFHRIIYSRVFPSKYHKLMLLPPDLVLTAALMTPKVLYMATRVMQVDVLYLVTHHLSIFFHCRIYLWGFPSKYHEIEDFTPGFGPNWGLNDPKSTIYGYACNSGRCVILVDSSSIYIFPLPNLFMGFSFKIARNWGFYPRILSQNGVYWPKIGQILISFTFA